MLSKAKKLLLGAIIGAAALTVAAPADAYYYYTFYYDNGSYAGTLAFCDNGQQLAFDGVTTSHYTYTSVPNSLPC